MELEISNAIHLGLLIFLTFLTMLCLALVSYRIGIKIEERKEK